MKRPSRREVLGSCVGGLASLAGCRTFSGASRSDCTDDELVHESDAPLSQSVSWPTYQYDAANTGHNPDASGPKDGVELAWRYPACTEASSGAVVDDGAVAAGGLVVNGQTGRQVGGEWDAHASTPTFADGRLYVGAHDLLARDASTGELDWTFETASDSGGLGAPAVVDGTVFAPGQFDDPTLYAVDASDGRENWTFESDGEIETPPAVAGSTVFVVDETSTVYALDVTNGDERWRRSPTAEIEYSTPVVADGTLYLGSNDGRLLALAVDDGSDIWRRDFGAGPLGSIAVAGDTLYLADPEGTLFALSASGGDERWNRSVDSSISGAPVVADGVVYFGADRTLYAFDASNGDERWQFETREVLFGDYVNGGISSGIAVVEDLVYVATFPGDLYALSEQ